MRSEVANWLREEIWDIWDDVPAALSKLLVKYISGDAVASGSDFASCTLGFSGEMTAILAERVSAVVFSGKPDDSRRFLFRAAAFKSGHKGQVPENYLAKAFAQAMAGKAVTETPLKEAGCSIAW